MFSKFTSISSFTRLALCLLLSAGIHGGLAFYDWLSRPAALNDGGAPVVVALVPAGKAPALPPDENADNLTEMPPAAAERPKVAKAAQTKPVKPVVEPPRIMPPKPKVPQAVSEEAENLSEDSMTADLVCVDPQDSTADSVEEAAESLPDNSRDQERASETHVEEVHAAQYAGSQASEDRTEGTSGGGVVEAVPDYRSNPLPEYPYIARQKRWEGVVWLLVDVTAQGRVDSLTIEQSCGHRILDRAASRSVRRWEFTPATRAGMPVASQVRIPVRFRLEGG